MYDSSQSTAEPDKSRWKVQTPGQTANNHIKYNCYTVAWVCALHTELAAARAVLDEIHNEVVICEEDNNPYLMGNIGYCNIVIACLPINQYGTNNAATLLTNMMRTFPSIKFGLVVGVGGGAPSAITDIRLGDIVVGTEVIQYDLGKYVSGGDFEWTGIPKRPSKILCMAVQHLISKHESLPNRISLTLRERFQKYPKYCRPKCPDRLFQATCNHQSSNLDCDRCDQTRLVQRASRPLTDPEVHYGVIASGNQIMKDGVIREKTAERTKALCFEMEAAGLMDILPCLPIRGICDYSDSHKNKAWQPWAAASAAAYARELLIMMMMSTTQRHNYNPIQPVVTAEQNLISKIKKRREYLMESLNFEHMESRYLTIRAADPGTCGWALNHSRYKAWLEPKNTKQHRGLLWISGKPGVGKSTLMKFLYDKHQMKDQGKKSLTASFFFNARGGSLEHSVTGMYRCFLYHLLEKFEDLRNILDDHHLPCRLDVEALKELFSRAIKSLDQRSFTCFVDALDECEDQEVDHMIHYFNRLTIEASAQGMQFRVCFSHRHHSRMNIGRGVKMTIENEQGHKTDLSNYISSRLQVASPYPFIHARDELLAKADGIFLWVVLVVEILNKASNRGEGNLQSKLNLIPTGLNELFRTMLERDNEHPGDLSFLILWILFTRRPLKREEFHHALLAGRAIGEPVSLEILIEDHCVTGETIDNFVMSSSKGLTQVTKNTQPQVEFVHESVRDFLIRDGGFQYLWPDLSRDGQVDGHEILAKCCITYLNHPSLLALFKRVPSRLQRDRGSWKVWSMVYLEYEQRYPFLGYAMENFLYHANAISDTSIRGRFITTIMANQYIQGWLGAEHYYRSQSRADTIDGLHGTTIPLDQSSDFLCYLVYHRLSRLVRAWLEHDPDFKFIVDGRRNPLTEALKRRDKDAVAALLGLPLSSHDEVKRIIDVLNPRHGNYECSGTLTMASRYGFNVMIDVLIKRGSLIDERGQQAKTSLMFASEYGQTSTVEKLLGHGADINAHDENGLTPLLLALNNGHRRVAMSLVEHNARIDLRGKDGKTALVLAASKGFEEIVCCLIDKGAHVDRRGIRGSDPLLAALEGGHHSTGKLLIKGAPDGESTECYVEETTLKESFWRMVRYHTQSLLN